MGVAELHTESRSSRLEQLIRLYETGNASELIDRVLDRVFAQEAANTQAAIQRLNSDIQNYENQYGMASDDFFRQFDSGELGDSMDFIEWSSLIMMREDLQQRLNILLGQK
jgi:hypothetical protein